MDTREVLLYVQVEGGTGRGIPVHRKVVFIDMVWRSDVEVATLEVHCFIHSKSYPCSTIEMVTLPSGLKSIRPR